MNGWNPRGAPNRERGEAMDSVEGTFGNEVFRFQDTFHNHEKEKEGDVGERKE
jgi:hypothetical protein